MGKFASKWRKKAAATNDLRSLKDALESIPIFHCESLRRLGSGYGGWVYVHDETLRGSPVVLAGVGEDISFDVELASRYGVKAFLLDPTQRSAQHFKEMQQRIGRRATEGYSLTGWQNPDAYDLSALKSGQFTFLNVALWRESGKLALYPPQVPEAVSVSLFPKKNSGDQSPTFFDSISPKSLAEKTGRNVALIKIDIEGAELEVLPSILSENPSLRQILVEFDFLKLSDLPSLEYLASILTDLSNYGFELVNRTGRNYSFWRP